MLDIERSCLVTLIERFHVSNCCFDFILLAILSLQFLLDNIQVLLIQSLGILTTQYSCINTSIKAYILIVQFECVQGIFTRDKFGLEDDIYLIVRIRGF